MNPLAATNEVHVPCAIFYRKSPPQMRGCLVFMKRASPRQHRTCAASVDSAILEAQLGGPDPDSAQEWAVLHDRHKRHACKYGAGQTNVRQGTPPVHCDLKQSRMSCPQSCVHAYIVRQCGRTVHCYRSVHASRMGMVSGAATIW